MAAGGKRRMEGSEIGIRIIDADTRISCRVSKGFRPVSHLSLRINEGENSIHILSPSLGL